MQRLFMWWAVVVALGPMGCVAQQEAQDNVQPQNFTPACSTPAYPSPPPAKPPGIDSSCGLTGTGGSEANQNAAKNNFCATGTPQPITLADLQQLQTQAANDPSIDFGDENSGSRQKGPQVDRAPLQAMGEGKLVTMTGYVLLARQEGAESVNCEKNVHDQPAYHDIHIELGDSASASDECSGIVAEMIPHHRPDSWTAGNVEKLAVAKPKLMVRVTGQLFFDSSHFPCENGQGVRNNPKRISLWEIHPIYKLEVCSSGDCTAGGQWMPLDQWSKTKRARAIVLPPTSQP